MLKPSGCGRGVARRCQFVKCCVAQPSIDFHASDAAIVSSRLPSHCRGPEAQDKTADAKQQIHAWGDPRLVRHSNCPAAQHYLGLQGTYRPEGEAAHSLTPTTTLSRRMEPATVEDAGCSATLSLSPPKASQFNPTCSRRQTPRPMLHWLPSPSDWSMAAICLLLGRTACTPAAGRG